MKIIIALGLLMISQSSFAACRWVWVDHDYNPLTPAIQKQVCDSNIDMPTIRPIEIRPIQQPSIRPIQIPVIPPIGATRCRIERVLQNGRWVDMQVCS